MKEEKKFVYEACYKRPNMCYKERKFFVSEEAAEKATKDFKDVEITEHQLYG